jgi:hypothetical protein
MLPRSRFARGAGGRGRFGRMNRPEKKNNEILILFMSL